MHLLKVMEDNLLHISYTVLMSRVVSFIKPLKKSTAHNPFKRNELIKKKVGELYIMN